MSNGPSRRRTPATYPRTQLVSAVDRHDLENLRHQLTYSDVDDVSIFLKEDVTYYVLL